jgi:CheY-like chemotaxis protein
MHLRDQAEAPAEAIAVITSAAPDVVLLDVHLPGAARPPFSPHAVELP